MGEPFRILHVKHAREEVSLHTGAVIPIGFFLRPVDSKNCSIGLRILHGSVTRFLLHKIKAGLRPH